MKNNFRQDLLEEIKDQASEKEAEELLEVAFKLNNLSAIRRSYNFKKAQVKKIISVKPQKRSFFAFPKILIPVFAALVLLLGSSTMVLAQKSLPGSTLYPVKRLSEDMIVKINPNFKQEIIQRRLEEEKEIKKAENHAGKEKDIIEEKSATTEAKEKNEIKTESQGSKKEIEETKEEKKIEDKENNNQVKGAEDKKDKSNENKSNVNHGNENKENKNAEKPEK